MKPQVQAGHCTQCQIAVSKPIESKTCIFDHNLNDRVRERNSMSDLGSKFSKAYLVWELKNATFLSIITQMTRVYVINL